MNLGAIIGLVMGLAILIGSAAVDLLQVVVWVLFGT